MKAFYSNSLDGFLVEDTDKIIGILTQKSGLSGFYQQLHTQTSSWKAEIEILKSAVSKVQSKVSNSRSSGILLEYPIARRGKRIDAVLIINGIIFIIEFKNGKSTFDSIDEEQLLDYCLDIRDFHKRSLYKKIVPVLLISKGYDNNRNSNEQSEYVLPVIFAHGQNISDRLEIALTTQGHEEQINYEDWENSDYEPTPTIIEAAQTLYAGKSVVEISRSHAGTKNLNRTSEAVINAIEYARQNNRKIICFITGVPGAGKTLAGLNIAHHPSLQNKEGALATFLSGNAPLIKVLREALARDSYKRSKTDGVTKKKEHDRVIAFIENVHRFIDNYFTSPEKIPNNKVVIFDEAQRAWNAEQSKRKFDRAFSEPEMMLEIMDRHTDWAAVVALIGGGQEINTGEAGLREWGNNIVNKFPQWEVFISSELKTGSHSTGNLTLFERAPSNVTVNENKDLHLDVSIRAYKAEELSHWVSQVLLNNNEKASQLFQDYLTEYKIVITRDINTAKEWLRLNCKGTRRMGMVASSGGRRLIAEGLDVKSELDAANWFLNPRTDVRASYYLEIPATEFSIQGLELDWTGVCWDLDLRRTNKDWDIKAFKGTVWQNVNSNEKRTYVLNKYRVLLTRAREGMVIWIPKGDEQDATRPPKEYDKIFNYLKSCGIPEI